MVVVVAVSVASVASVPSAALIVSIASVASVAGPSQAVGLGGSLWLCRLAVGPWQQEVGAARAAYSVPLVAE